MPYVVKHIAIVTSSPRRARHTYNITAATCREPARVGLARRREDAGAARLMRILSKSSVDSQHVPSFGIIAATNAAAACRLYAHESLICESPSRPRGQHQTAHARRRPTVIHDILALLIGEARAIRKPA